MDVGELDDYLRGLGLTVEIVQGEDGNHYTVVRDFMITQGSLKGKTCDVAIMRPTQVPYVVPAAIHTKPHLLEMNSAAPLATQPGAGKLGAEWQYWSRRYDRSPTPKGIWTHILTIFKEV